MEIRNKSKGITISSGAQAAGSFQSRLLGLMFSKPRDLVLISPREDVPSSAIHMMFMRFPIDVIWVDSGLTVVDVKKKAPPLKFFDLGTWRVYKPRTKARYVIELGSSRAEGTEIGDIVEFMPSPDSSIN